MPAPRGASRGPLRPGGRGAPRPATWLRATRYPAPPWPGTPPRHGAPRGLAPRSPCPPRPGPARRSASARHPAPPLPGPAWHPAPRGRQPLSASAGTALRLGPAHAPARPAPALPARPRAPCGPARGLFPLRLTAGDSHRTPAPRSPTRPGVAPRVTTGCGPGCCRASPGRAALSTGGGRDQCGWDLDCPGPDGRRGKDVPSRLERGRAGPMAHGPVVPARPGVAPESQRSTGLPSAPMVGGQGCCPRASTSTVPAVPRGRNRPGGLDAPRRRIQPVRRMRTPRGARYAPPPQGGYGVPGPAPKWALRPPGRSGR
ncbi:UNVERIFIED_CONTAM: hypothetical protein RKD43_005159 [Streptomyces graminofaciens]